MTIDLSKYPNFLEFIQEERARQDEEEYALLLISIGVRIDSVAEWVNWRRRQRYEK